MRKYFIPYCGFFVVFLAIFCTPKAQPGISEDFNVSGIILPDEIECFAGETIELKVLRGRGPSLTDEVELSGEETCRMPVKEAEGNRFTFVLSEDLFSGNYRMSIVRGDRSRSVGRTRLIISTGIDIDPQDATVYGQVTARGKGIADVVVSDGVEVTQTDQDGIYRLPSQKKHGYVFVSVPSGYEPLANGILPCFHKQLRASATIAERQDFSLRAVEGQDNSTVLVMGDIHLARRTGDRTQFADFIRDVNAYTASRAGRRIYGLTLGDMVWDLYWKVNDYGFADYLRDANGIKDLMIYHTIGNHDHSMYYTGDFDTVKEYKRELAPTYYSFNVGKVHFIVLDDVECTNSEPDTDSKGNPCYKRTYVQNVVGEALAWLEKDLTYVPEDTPLVLAMHIPLYKNNAAGTYQMDQGVSRQLERLLEPWPEVHFFTAHTHKMYNVDKLSSQRIYEHNAGSVCGTWWWSGYETPGIHIGPDGSPGGYTVLDLEGTRLKWQYKATGFPVSHQFRSYDRNCIHITAAQYAPSATKVMQEKMDGKTGFWKTPSADNEVYVNVWNADPSWSVEVTENGVPLPGSLDRTALDPLHIIAYMAKRFNRNVEPSFETARTSHIYKFQARQATSTLQITVTDRFGTVYTETMERPKVFNTDTYQY